MRAFVREVKIYLDYKSATHLIDRLCDSSGIERIRHHSGYNMCHLLGAVEPQCHWHRILQFISAILLDIPSATPIAIREDDKVALQGPCHLIGAVEPLCSWHLMNPESMRIEYVPRDRYEEQVLGEA